MKREDSIQQILESFITLRKVAVISDGSGSDLSRAQFGFLLMLAHHQGSTINQISGFLGIGKSAVSQLADPLVVKKMVKRQNDPNDRRIVHLHLTAAGQKALAQCKQKVLDGLSEALNKLSNSEIDQLAKLHQKVINNIKK
jgi:DNA-binding MarR family transcriptional regulator